MDVECDGAGAGAGCIGAGIEGDGADVECDSTDVECDGVIAECNGTIAECDSTDVAALVELLRAYPELLGSEVAVVARALAQATVAAARTAAGGGARAAAERIRAGKTLARAEATARSAYWTSQGSRQPGHDGARAREGARRWFTAAHVQQLEREGVAFRKGKFTPEENAAIDAALAEFAQRQGLAAGELHGWLFPRVDPGDGTRAARRGLWAALADALPQRQIQAIYHHVRRKLHPHNYQGAWTAGEDARLRRLVDTHGPAWEAIARQLGRMGTNCRDRWRYMQQQQALSGQQQVLPGQRPQGTSPAAPD
ncbi:RNA polymerase I enhancer binding protein [Coemansia sp. RSA 552]|nr:RNA polymerase I enhancer binding protein [Coemansia sp. RSA 552]